MAEATDVFDKRHKHLLYDKNNDNVWPIAIAVCDDTCHGKLGPILWVSFLHLCHFYQEERYGFGSPVMSCLGMVTYTSVYVLFVQYWRLSWDVLWDCTFFSQTVNLHWVSVRLEKEHKFSHFRGPSVIPVGVVGHISRHLNWHHIWLWIFCPFQTWLSLNLHNSLQS